MVRVTVTTVQVPVTDIAVSVVALSALLSGTRHLVRRRDRPEAGRPQVPGVEVTSRLPRPERQVDLLPDPSKRSLLRQTEGRGGRAGP